MNKLLGLAPYRLGVGSRSIITLIKDLPMGHRSIVLLISMVLAFASSGALALGLGKIKLESSLNQPLLAEIELLEVRDLTEREILVGIASREDFDRIGVDKVYFLSDLKFKVVLARSGPSKIIISSSKPVREPYLNFVVEAQWPSGKLLREYTLLMDLPVFGDSAPTPVQSTTTAPTYSQPSTTTSTQTMDSEYNPRSSYTPDGGSARPRSQSQQPVTPTYTGDAYEVAANDTLWEIAARVRPSRSVSIQQTMLAIQAQNPQAFINNNINLLKKGQILRIPDADEMASTYSRQNAVQEVATQNAQWGGSDSGSAQLSGGRSYESESSYDDEPEGRVKLSSPDDLYASSEGRGSGGTADASTEALENELAITMEQLDKSSRENDELRTKIQSLEDQIQTMEKMVEVSNENMRALELAAVKNEQDAAEQALVDEVQSTPETQIEDLYRESQQTEEEPLFDEEETEAGTAVAEVTPIPTPDETAETPAPTATPDNTKAVAPPPAPEKGILDLIMENVIYIAAGIIALALIAFVFLRRKSSDDEDFDEFLRQSEEEPASFAEESLVEDADQGDDIDLGQFEDSEPESIDESFEEEAPEEEQDLEAETEDVVAEADIYIAYGKYDQVEDMLLRALDRDASDENVRLKLLEVFSLQHNVEKFDEHYTKLREGGSQSVIDRAERFRDNIPNAPEFEGESISPPSTKDYTSNFAEADSSEPEDMSLDLDFGDLDSDGELDDGLDLDGDSGDDDGLDLDLDFGDDSSSEGDSIDDEDDLALDLDLGDDADDALNSSDGGLDLDLDFDSSDDETPANSASASDASDDDDLDLDLDFDSADDSDDTDLDLGEFDLDLEDGDSDSGKSGLSLTDDLASLDDSIGAGLDSADTEEDDDLSLETSSSDENSDSLDLGDDDDLDLSSLDKELDALTSDMEDLGDLDDFGGEETSSSAPMEEPVTDFDDLDDLAADLDKSASGSDFDEMGEDSMFDEAISQVPEADESFELPEIDSSGDDDGDLDFLSDSDETGTKLDLARAYIDMGDQEGARDIIKEILSEGNDEQKTEAQGLLARIEA